MNVHHCFHPDRSVNVREAVLDPNLRDHSAGIYTEHYKIGASGEVRVRNVSELVRKRAVDEAFGLERVAFVVPGALCGEPILQRRDVKDALHGAPAYA